MPERARFIAVTTPPKGQRRLHMAELGMVSSPIGGKEIVRLYVETAGPNRVRFLITSGNYLVQTDQFTCPSYLTGRVVAIENAFNWIRNTSGFAAILPRQTVQMPQPVMEAV